MSSISMRRDDARLQPVQYGQIPAGPFVNSVRENGCNRECRTAMVASPALRCLYVLSLKDDFAILQKRICARKDTLSTFAVVRKSAEVDATLTAT